MAAVDVVGCGWHTCAVYDSDDEQRAAVGGFLTLGLRTGHKVVGIAEAASTWRILEEHLETQAGATAARRGQVALRSASSAYVAGGFFEPARMLALIADEADRAVAEGFRGLFLTADTSWAARSLPGVGRLVEYEHGATGVLSAHGGTALCLYDRRRLDDRLVREAWRAHRQRPQDLPVAPPETFRALVDAPGRMRLVGELDASETHTVVDSIEACLHDGASSLDIDVSRLAFIDAAGTAALCRPAADGRARIVLRGPRPATRKVVSLLGFDRLPSVRVVDQEGT